MKKTLLSIYILSSFSMANSIEINQLKWTQDFETLVSLNANTENTLEGIDQNKNNVRDDVEYYVNKKYHDKPFQKAMFLKAAQKMQTIITLENNTNIQKRQKLDQELLSLYTCRDYILYRLDSQSLDKDLEEKLTFKAKVLNTEKRLRAYIAHKQQLPFEFDELSDTELKKEKKTCVNQYNKYKNIDTNLLSSTN